MPVEWVGALASGAKEEHEKARKGFSLDLEFGA